MGVSFFYLRHQLQCLRILVDNRWNNDSGKEDSCKRKDETHGLSRGQHHPKGGWQICWRRDEVISSESCYFLKRITSEVSSGYWWIEGGARCLVTEGMIKARLPRDEERKSWSRAVQAQSNYHSSFSHSMAHSPSWQQSFQVLKNMEFLEHPRMFRIEMCLASHAMNAPFFS